MRKLFLLLALFGVLAVGCEELLPNEQKPNATPVFNTDGENDYIIGAEGAEITVMVTTNIDYSVVIPEDAKDWLSVTTTRSETREETLTFTAAPNDTDKIRYAFVELIDADNNVLQEIPFIQSAITQSDSSCPNDEIWYTNGSTTEATTPYATDVFGANIVSNTYDAAKECWVIKFDGDVTTIGNYAFGWCSSLTSVTIPDSVTSIGNHTFHNCISLTCVTIPDSVTTIGNYAFYECHSLTSVTIPDSVTEIGERAFSDCSNLTSVTIPNSVTTIGDGTFYNCSSLTSVTIPDSITTIGDEAFCWCVSLTSVIIPDSVTTIGEMAFCGCSRLTSVTIPDSVTTIGESVFCACSSLQEFKGKFASEDGRCLIIDGTLNSFAPAGLTEYTIPDSVTTIGNSAFNSCYSLTSVTIPDSVTSIGNNAFWNCDSLTSVYCKPTTPPVGDSSMFEFNAEGRKFYVPMESVEAYKSADGWSDYADAIVGYDFENGVAGTPKPANNEIWYTNGSTTEATTPYETGVFGANIVSNTYDAANECWIIKFDSEVTTIGEGAFYDCDSLTSVTIGDSVTTIRVCAFEDCSSLTSVNIPNSVTTIGNYAFYGCSSLTSVNIPDSVTTIGNAAFSVCSSLQEFNGKFASEDGRCLIIDDTLNSFAPAGLTEYIISNSVTEIGYDAFYGCHNLTSVTIPDSVTTIGEGAFYGCSSLTSVTIPDSVTTIGEAAFYGCSSLTSVYCKPTTPPVGDYSMFEFNAEGRKIYVPMESVDAYKSAEWWSEYADAIEGYNF